MMMTLTEWMCLHCLIGLPMVRGQYRPDVPPTCPVPTESRRDCVFPFTYDNMDHNHCIVGGFRGVPWCSLTSDYDKDGQASECIIYSTLNHAPCVFPFVHVGIIRNECTDYGGTEGIYWCGVQYEVVDSDSSEDEWGYCQLDGECPDTTTPGEVADDTTAPPLDRVTQSDDLNNGFRLNDVIAVAAGGAGLILLVAIIIGIICYRRKRVRRKEDHRMQADQGAIDQHENVLAGKRNVPKVLNSPNGADYETRSAAQESEMVYEEIKEDGYSTLQNSSQHPVSFGNNTTVYYNCQPPERGYEIPLDVARGNRQDIQDEHGSNDNNRYVTILD